MKIIKIFFPLALFLIVGFFLWRGLYNDPRQIPSPLIGKPFPVFTATDLLHPNQQITAALFKGHVSLLNVFASWCDYCLQEHALISDIANSPSIYVYGLNYKDDPNAAKSWLKQYGNPFRAIISDPAGTIAINLGVYGTPETFIIDKQGIIRYKHIGAVTESIWHKVIYPIVLGLAA